MLQPVVCPELRRYGQFNQITFQHDDARVQTPRLSTNVLNVNGVEVMTWTVKLEWYSFLMYNRDFFIFQDGVPDSKTFDVTLMICLIRNLTSIISPINGFDNLPLPGETTPGSDLARIKWYRNILAHHESNTMAITEFNTAWTNIPDAVSRIGGLPLNQECQELKVKILDQSNQEIMLEIKQSQEEMKELRRTIDIEHSTMNMMKESLKDLQDSHITLQTEHSRATENLKEVTEMLKDPIPWNMRGHIKEKLETWTKNDKTFIETNGAKRVLACIEHNGCVVVTGSSGCGKSALMRHVAIQMRNKGCEILPVSNPKEIIKWHNPSRKTMFVVDDFCGTYTLNPIKYENWKNTMETIKSLVEKKPVKLIMSCRLQNPFTVYKEELDKLHTEEANGKYCALALCVMFNNRLKEKWLTQVVDDDIKSIIRNTYEHCKVLEGTSRLILRDELDSLTQTFIKKDGDVYRTIHDKLFDFLAFYFGSVMIDCLINNATSRLIRERFLFERKRKSDEFIIIVPEKYKDMYINRMIDDWSRGNVVDVFSNINTENQIFKKNLWHVLRD
ncbi:unnamed protein product [Mytilus coruscus]|uniref:Uncharacterized protein n=1 Tax=Mytilus coruscus TaxID=42192 RepID=A0A6J8BVK1_MYTCO|nr:unnamed protein product [Mytilus coruscus]